MDRLQKYIANAIGIQGIPHAMLDSIVPIVYERDSGCYLLRLERGWKLRGFDCTVRAFRKLVSVKENT